MSLLGPSMVGHVPHIHVVSPQYFEGWLTCLPVSALNLFTVYEGNSGCSMGTYTGDPVPCLPKTLLTR